MNRSITDHDTAVASRETKSPVIAPATLSKVHSRFDQHPAQRRTGPIATLFGLSLPIYEVGDIPPEVFAAARMLLAVLLLMRVLPIIGQDQRRIHAGWYVLGYGVLVAGIANLDSGAILYLLTTVPAVFLGYGLALRGYLWPVLQGYRHAVFLSAVSALLATWGILDLTPAVGQAYGNPGLSYRSTALAYELAIGLVIWAFAYRKTSRAWPGLWLAEGLTLLLALLASGGRGGFVATLLVVLVLHLSGHRRRTFVIIATGLAGLAVWVAVDDGPLTWQRVLGNEEAPPDAPAAEYSSGRVHIYDETFAKIAEDPIFGSGFSSTVGPERLEHASSPHNAILSLMLYAGIIPAIAGAAILLSALGVILRNLRRQLADQWPAAILIVIVCQSLVESGAFFGAAAIVLFTGTLCAAGLPSERPLGAIAESGPRQRRLPSPARRQVD